MNQKHLLVLGCPRSGTTLLAAMLGAHSSIALLNEVDFRLSRHIFSKPVIGTKLTIPNEIDLNRKASRLQFVLARLPVMKHIYRKTLQPARMEAISDFLASPQLHIMGIVRDPESTIKSNQERSGQTRHRAEYRWKRSLEILDYLLTTHPRTHIVRYDHLVSEPKETISQALTFLECNFEPTVLNGYQHTPQYPGQSQIDPTKALPLEMARNDPLLKSNERLYETYMRLINYRTAGSP